jgi:hypothetical protein
MLPGALHDPGHGSLQPLRFLLDLVEHRLWKIETLLALVALGSIRTALVLLVGHSATYCDMFFARTSRGLGKRAQAVGRGPWRVLNKLP